MISLEEIIKTISRNPSIANRCRVLDIDPIDGMGINEYGDKEHWKNGKLHREDGPAVEYLEGTKSWFKNGNLHRLDGPAVEHSDGYKAWWVNGILLEKAGCHRIS